MNNLSSFRPNWVSPPGETISDIILRRQISLYTLAESMEIPIDDIQQILAGNLPIDLKIADGLRKNIGGTTEFWIKREERYRLDLHRLEKNWFKDIPLKDLVSLGWIKKEMANLNGCYKFFKVKSLFEWNNKYTDLSKQVAFRKSNTYQGRIGSIAAWLNQAEILALKMETKEWNKRRFTNSLSDIRELTNEKSVNIFIPKLKFICAQNGVSLVVLKTPSSCPINGATKFLPNGKPLLLLSFRYLSDDQFWFTFFHEAGHLILHEEKLNLEVKDPRSFTDEKELEANQFAEETLIPDLFRKEMMTMKIDKFSIVRFARRVGVSSGIIVGQLQYMKRIKYSYFNPLKRRFNWKEINTVSS